MPTHEKPTYQREQERKRFFDLTERLVCSRDPEEQVRLKEELARMTFGN